MSQSSTTQNASWEDYFELKTGGLGPKYQYIDTAVIELPDNLPQPPSDYPTMFSGCHKLVNINALAKWDASKITSTVGMFNHCRSLIDISPLKYWNISNVTDMRSMFNCCYELADVSAIRKWDISNVKHMKYIFNGCYELPDFARLEVYDQQTFNCFVNRYLSPIPPPYPHYPDQSMETSTPSIITENTQADSYPEDSLSESLCDPLMVSLTPSSKCSFTFSGIKLSFCPLKIITGILASPAADRASVFP